MLPVVSQLLPHVHQRLTVGWGALLKGPNGDPTGLVKSETREDTFAANEEIVQERLLRELTAEHLILLRFSQDAPEGVYSS